MLAEREGGEGPENMAARASPCGDCTGQSVPLRLQCALPVAALESRKRSEMEESIWAGREFPS